jgi:hypothetical protein
MEQSRRRALHEVPLCLGAAAWFAPAFAFIYTQAFVPDVFSSSTSTWSQRTTIQMVGFAVGFVIAVAGFVLGLSCFSGTDQSKVVRGGIGLCFAYIIALLAVGFSERAIFGW